MRLEGSQFNTHHKLRGMNLTRDCRGTAGSSYGPLHLRFGHWFSSSLDSDEGLLEVAYWAPCGHCPRSAAPRAQMQLADLLQASTCS